MVGRVLVALLVAGLSAWPCAASAQEAQRIAAVVNDDIISTFDLAERVELVVRTTGLPDNQDTRERIRPQVLRSLIDERLEVQEAARLGITIADADVQTALRFLERQNHLPEGKILEALAQRGVEADTLLAQIDAQLKWSRIVQSRLRQTVTIADAEVAELIARITAGRGKPEVRLAEIYLAADDPSREADVMAVARRLMDDIKAGADFAALARQVSQSASASGGGDLGWTLEDQLADELRIAVQGVPEGALVGPVATRGGLAVLAVVGRRRALEPDQDDTLLDLALIALPLPQVSTGEQEQEQLLRAEQARQRVTGCADAEAAAKATPTAQYRPLGEVRLGGVVPSLRGALADLQPGQTSQPVIAGGIVNVLVVCARTEPQSRPPTRDEARQTLYDQRLDLLARGYLRDLRRRAFVDIRL